MHNFRIIFQKGSRPYKSVALHMHEAGLKQCAILLTQWTPLFLYIPGPLCDVVFKKAASEVSFSLRADMLHRCRFSFFI